MIQLRPYQIEGVERILDRRNQLLLAMVMGSGKTVTCSGSHPQAASATRRSTTALCSH